MKRGQKTGAEQVVLKLGQIEVQTAQGKSLWISVEADSTLQCGSTCSKPKDFLLRRVPVVVRPH